jgi:hypothetical protein
MNGNLGRPYLNLECHYVLLNGSLFSFEGFVSGSFVSGINNQARKTVVSAAAAMLRNPIAPGRVANATTATCRPRRMFGERAFVCFVAGRNRAHE